MPGDSSFNSVSLLLHFDGAEGSTAVKDSSPSARAVTANGSIALTTAQSLFGGSSLALSGSSTANNLSCAAAAAFVLGGAAFTIEFSVRIGAYNSGGGRLISAGGGTVAWNSTSGIHYLVQTNADGISFGWWTGSTQGGINVAIPLNTWAKIALTYDGTTVRAFKDGVLASSATSTVAAPSTTPSFAIGRLVGEGATATYAPNAHLDEVRITKGVCRYTADFTAPTTPYPDGIAQVAGQVTDDTGAPCARIVRAYRRATGALAGETYSGPGDANYNSVVLLLRGDGLDGSTTFTDSSVVPKTPTVFGNARISTAQSKFGGSSMYFDGNGDYLSYASHSSLQFGSGDFTVEAWVRLSGYATVNAGVYASTIFAKDVAGAREFNFIISGTASSFTTLGVTGFVSGAGTGVTVSHTFNLDTWYHVAAVRSGNLLYLFVDGVLKNPGGAAFNLAITATSAVANVGALAYDATYRYHLNGYIDDLRVTKGVARYTADFTPPQDRLPAKREGSVGDYDLWLPTTDEHNIVFLDDDVGTLYNDIIHRVIPA